VDKEKVRQMSENELRDEEAKLTTQLFKLRIQKAKGQLTNPQRIKLVRRDVARVKTLIREHELDQARKAEE
jgi:large subunit ribosomal protein L29